MAKPLKFEVGQIVMLDAPGITMQGTVERCTSRSVDVWWHQLGKVRRYALDQIRPLRSPTALKIGDRVRCLKTGAEAEVFGVGSSINGLILVEWDNGGSGSCRARI